jgi:hypothetical protein
VSEWFNDILSFLRLLLGGVIFLALFIGAFFFKAVLKWWLESHAAGHVLAELTLLACVVILIASGVRKLRARRRATLPSSASDVPGKSATRPRNC